MDVNKLLSLEPRTLDFISELEPKVGFVEHITHGKLSGDIVSTIRDSVRVHEDTDSVVDGHSIDSGSGRSCGFPTARKLKVAVVGSGPAGLFASLVLAELGADVTLIERGQAVEQRGRDIGALVVRKLMQQESNFCFGEVVSCIRLYVSICLTSFDATFSIMFCIEV